jgi:hypothetical protein
LNSRNRASRIYVMYFSENVRKEEDLRIEQNLNRC